MSSQYHEYKPSAARRTLLFPLSSNRNHDDQVGDYYKDILHARPFDKNDPRMPRKRASGTYPTSIERADDWNVDSVADVPVRADLDGGHRIAGAVDVRESGRRRMT